MRVRTILLAFAITACGEPEEAGRSDVVPVYYLPYLRHHSDAVIEGAEEILGLELDVQEDPEQGAVVLYLHGTTAKGGAAKTFARCAPVTWAKDHPWVLAHEIGHALGLGHDDDRDNLMNDQIIDTELTDEQVDLMRWTAWWLLNECEL